MSYYTGSAFNGPLLMGIFYEEITSSYCCNMWPTIIILFHSYRVWNIHKKWGNVPYCNINFKLLPPEGWQFQWSLDWGSQLGGVGTWVINIKLHYHPGSLFNQIIQHDALATDCSSASFAILFGRGVYSFWLETIVPEYRFFNSTFKSSSICEEGRGI